MATTISITLQDEPDAQVTIQDSSTNVNRTTVFEILDDSSVSLLNIDDSGNYSGTTGSMQFSSATDGTETVSFGSGNTDRYASVVGFASQIYGGQAGETNDRSFFNVYGTTIQGMEFGYFLNETSLLGARINIFGGGNFEVFDEINSKGMIYASDYSSNYTDRSIVDKAYVDSATDTLYTANGTLTGNRVVTGNSSDDLTFNHYNGTSSTYTLRSQLLMEDADITVSASLGDGFGADLATDSISMLNSGIEINTGIGDADVYQRGNDWVFYEGSSSSSDATVTVHGDGNHSVFDPFVTLHEGFATGNGTNAQPLICNFGKAAQVQWNDGTRSVDVFHIHGIVNGSETFTHMETSFQSTRHDYVDIDRWDWYFDTAGTTNEINIYDDDAGSNNIFRLDDAGDLRVLGRIGIGSTSLVPTHMLDLEGPTNANCEAHVNANGNFSAILQLDSENAWEFQSYHFEAATSNQGQLEIRNDTAGQLYLTFSDIDKEVEVDTAVLLTQDGGNIVPGFPSCVVGTSLAQTVTGTDAVIPFNRY